MRVDLEDILDKLYSGKLTEKEALKNIIDLESDRECTIHVGNDVVSAQDDLPLSLVEDFLKSIIGKEINKGVGAIDSMETFDNYGISSLIIIKINNHLEKHFGELSKTLFYEFHTIHELADYFLVSHNDKLRQILKDQIDHRTASSRSGAKQERTPQVASNRSGAKPEHTPQVTSTVKLSRTMHKPDEIDRPSDIDNADIAIVGFAGKYPQADSLHNYWKNIIEGTDCITIIPKERWDYRHTGKSSHGETQHEIGKWGGFINGVDQFDPSFFNITPSEAELMDPQERLFLETAWSTVESAGHTKSTLSNELVGVYVGVMWSHYQLYNSVEVPGSSYASIANRVSYYFDFHGPSMALDTMCSSSLTAIHLAVDSLRKGEITVALAGGVNTNIHPNKYIELHKKSFLSSDGRCRSFGEGGDGYVPGEGVGAVLLKTVDKALHDQDRIYGIIKSTSVNHGGRTSGFTVPNQKMQKTLIAQSFDKTNITPSTIDYIEAHGTGTSLGDPIEINALNSVYQDSRKDGPCYIGSVKSNIGHLESAAGIAGLTKLLLQLRYHKIAPSLHSHNINKNINMENTGFSVPQVEKDWTPPRTDVSSTSDPRRAALSSFGAGGSNAHVLLEDFNADEDFDADNEQATLDNSDHLIVLSAPSKHQLAQYVERLFHYLQTESKYNPRFAVEYAIANIAYTLQMGRDSLKHRLAIIVGSTDELIKQMHTITTSELDDYAYYRAVDKEEDVLKILFDDTDRTNLKEIVGSCNANKLAQLWIRGVTIDWNDVLQNHSVVKVMLPSFPLNHRRYWVETRDGVSQTFAGGSDTVRISTTNHEDIKMANAARHTIQQYSASVEDHRVFGETIVPGAVQLSMAITSSKVFQGVPNKPCIKTATFVDFYAIRTRDDYLQLQGADDNSFTIVGPDGNLLCVGEFGEWQETDKLENLNIAQSENRFRDILHKEEIYSTFLNKNINFGDSFQTLEWIKYDSDTALSKFSCQDTDSAAPRYRLTSIIDSAFQSTLSFVAYNQNAVFIPYSIENLSLHQKNIDSVGYCFVRKLESSENEYTFHLSIYDAQGKLSIQIEKFVARSRPNVVEEKTNTFTYDYDLASPMNGPEQTQEEVVFINSLSNTLSITVDYGRSIDIDEHQLSDDTAASMKYLQQTFSKIDFYNRCYVFTLDLHGTDTDIDLYYTFLMTFFYVTKFLVSESHQPIKILVIVRSTKQVEHYAYSLYSFLQSLKLEYVNFQFKVVLFGDQQQSWVAQIKQESRSIDNHYYKYVGESRYVRSLSKVEIHEPQNPDAVYKYGGVYVITGGLGEVGKLVATHLVEKYRANVVLIGTKPLTAERAAFVAQLNLHGELVTYYSCDITNRTSVKNIFTKLLERHGQCNGVFHCAGILDDALLPNKDYQRFRNVILPKIAGVDNVVSATQHIPMDFICLYSSLSSVLGNPGQTDYSLANGYLDGFAQMSQTQREGQPLVITSINWPLWHNSGMGVTDSESEAITRRTGIVPIQPDQGIALTDRILSQKCKQISVMPGNLHTIERYLNNKNETKTRTKKITKKEATQSLIAVLSKHTKHLLDDIEIDKTFDAYGMDSVMIMNITRDLERDYGELPKTLFFQYKTIAALTDWMHDNVTISKAGTESISSLPTYLEPIAKNILSHSSAESVQRIRAPNDNDVVHTQVSKPTATVQESESNDNKLFEAMAIIGVAGTYPNANDLSTYWNNLLNGRDCVHALNGDRWSVTEDGPSSTFDKSINRWGGIIDNVYDFDPLFFNITPKDALLIDPQERLFLSAVRGLLDNAGYSQQKLAEQYNNNVGVFVGVMNGDYQNQGVDLLGSKTAHTPLSLFSSVANRVSYCFDLVGPSIAVDTMCSSSLTSLHYACNSIAQGDCEVAIGGGVNLLLHPYKYMALTNYGFLSSHGKCKSYGIDGDGYVPGEGIGAVLIKSLKRALRDGDYIHGIIRSTAINHGGKSNGYTVPSVAAQQAVIEQAIQKSGADKRQISYIEGHGTGTKLGDPIEIDALKAVFEKSQDVPRYIGSVKSNIGHLESAAGVAALTKVLLQMKHKTLAPTIHSAITNPNIQLGDSNIRICKQAQPWESDNSLIASISSFGAGGANANIIVESFEHASEDVGDDNIHVLPFSAPTQAQLVAYLRDVKTYCYNSRETTQLGNIAYTLAFGRNDFQQRIVICANSLDELFTAIDAFVNQEQSDFLIDAEHTQSKIYNTNPAVDSHLIRKWLNGGRVNWPFNQKQNRRIEPIPTFPLNTKAIKIVGKIQHSKTSENTLYTMERIIDPLIVSSSDANAATLDIGLIVRNEEDRLSTICQTLKQQFSAVYELTSTDSKSAEQEQSKITEQLKTIEKGIKSKQKRQTLYIIFVKSVFSKADYSGASENASQMMALQAIVRMFYNTPLQLINVFHAESGYTSAAMGYFSALSSLQRSLSFEHAFIHSQSLALIGPNKDLGQILKQELLTSQTAGTVFYKEDNRTVEKISRVHSKSTGSLTIECNKLYVVTGATGAIGKQVVQYLVSKGVKTIAVFGNTLLPEKKAWKDVLANTSSSTSQKATIQYYLDLEQSGVTLIYCSLNLANRNDVTDSFARLEKTNTSLGGIFHCAGKLDRNNGAFINKRPEDIKGVLEPKTQGLVNLCEQVKKQASCFLIAFSSVSSEFHSLSVGLSDYAAANRFMNAFIQSENNPLIKSIVWPNWKEAGYGEIDSPVYVQTAFGKLSNQEGIAILDQCLSQDESLILPLKNNNIDHVNAQYTAFTLDKNPESSHGGVAVKQQETNSKAQQYANAEQLITNKLQTVLMLDDHEVSIDKEFSAYGVESIMMMDLKSQLEKEFGVELEPTVLIEHSTIEKLSQYIHGLDYTLIEKDVVDLTTSQDNSAIDTSKTIITNQYPRDDSERIAIVGVSCRLPKTKSLEQLWHNLANRVDMRTPMPVDRYVKNEDRKANYWGYYLDDIYEFDPAYFAIREKDAQLMDPQARILLEEALFALLDSGHDKEDVNGINAGVYIGARTSTYLNQFDGYPKNTIIGVGQNFYASHISHYFNLKGPSMVIDTACSSSITAITLAKQALLSNDIQCALVGGVNLLLDEVPFEVLSSQDVLSNDGRVNTFDNSANGFALGEGVGMIVLKRLSDAIRDNDKIYCVVESCSINNSGNTMGFTTPSIDAQIDVVEQALSSVRRPQDIQYIETNGAATQIGDLIELKALSACYRKHIKAANSVYLGSIKNSMGHLLNAAGMASIIKSVMMIQQKEIPPFFNIANPNKHFDFQNSIFSISSQDKSFPVFKPGGLVAINSLGDGGGNGHLVLGDYSQHQLGVVRQPLARPVLNRKAYLPTSSVGMELHNEIERSIWNIAG